MSEGINFLCQCNLIFGESDAHDTISLWLLTDFLPKVNKMFN